MTAVVAVPPVRARRVVTIRTHTHTITRDVTRAHALSSSPRSFSTFVIASPSTLDARLRLKNQTRRQLSHTRALGRVDARMDGIDRTWCVVRRHRRERCARGAVRVETRLVVVFVVVASSSSRVDPSTGVASSFDLAHVVIRPTRARVPPTDEDAR